MKQLKIRQDQQGVMAVEMAILAPLIFFLIFCTFEITYTQMVEYALNRVASKASDYAITGQALTDSSGNPILIAGAPAYGAKAIEYMANQYMQNLHLVSGSANVVVVPDPTVMAGWDRGTPAEPCKHATGYNDSNDANCSLHISATNYDCFSDVNNDGTRQLTLPPATDGAILLYKLHYETPYILGTLIHALGFGTGQGKYVYDIAFAGRHEGAAPKQVCA